jgi:hypothetical protein
MRPIRPETGLLDFRPPPLRRQGYVTRHSLFHMLAYDYSDAAGGGTNADSSAYTDPEFSQRNSHYIFTEPYNLIASYVGGVSASDARFNVPRINALGYHHLQGVNTPATAIIPTPAQIEDLRRCPLTLPTLEEIAVQASDTAGVATHVETFLWIATPDHVYQCQQSSAQLAGFVNPKLTFRFTATVNSGAYSWSGLTAIVPEVTLRGGWYTVLGVQCVVANLLAYRMVFARSPLYMGRRLRPGNIGVNAVGNYPVYYDRGWLGPWGSFHTFELPQIEAVSAAGGNLSVVGYVDAIYWGNNPPTGYSAIAGAQ